MSDPKFNAADARALFAGLDQIHIVCIHPNGLQIVGKEFAQNIENAIEYAEAMNSQGLNVYWSVNRVRDNLHKKASKADVVAARFCQVDLDPPKNGGAFDKGAIIEGLAGFEAPPSFIIDSGGGLNAFWRLDGVCQNLGSIEYINQQIRDYCDADHCWNIDRIMRVPGSINWPDAKKRARGRVASMAKFVAADDGTVYEPHVLSAAFPPAKISAQTNSENRIAVEMPDGVDMETPDTLGMGMLDELRSAINEPRGLDRSADGMSVARKMANAGYSDAQIIGILLNPENPVSAHFVSNQNPQRAVVRVIGEVRRDSPEPFGQGPIMSDQDFQSFVENMKARAEKAPVEQVAPVCAESEQSEAEAWWLDDLGDNPIGQFVRHVCDTAIRPQPFITLGAALTIFGTAAGRRYASPTNIRTNLYAIGICDSGGGKDHPIKRATELMVQAGQQHKMGGSSIASGQAILTDLTNNPALMYAIDEIGFLISSAADANRAPKHLAEIMKNLTKLYSQANSVYLGTSYANQKERPREVIEQPCLSLFGVTTPGVFWGSLSSANVIDGSLGRMVIFQSENDYPIPQFNAPRRDMPAQLVMAIQRVVEGAKGHNAFPIGEGHAQPCKPYEVPYGSPEVEKYYQSMAMKEHRLLEKHKATNENAMIARYVENAVKMALIRAIAANPTSPVLTVRDLEWGDKLSWQSVSSLLKAVRERVADNVSGENLKRLQSLIAESGINGIDGSALGIKAQGFLTGRAYGETLKHILDIELSCLAMVKRKDGKPGKPKRMYYAAEHREELEAGGIIFADA